MKSIEKQSAFNSRGWLIRPLFLKGAFGAGWFPHVGPLILTSQHFFGPTHVHFISASSMIRRCTVLYQSGCPQAYEHWNSWPKLAIPKARPLMSNSLIQCSKQKEPHQWTGVMREKVFLIGLSCNQLQQHSSSRTYIDLHPFLYQQHQMSSVQKTSIIPNHSIVLVGL